MRDSAVNLCIVLVSVPLLQLAWGQAGPGGAGPGGMGPPTDLPNDLSTEPPVTNMVDMNDNTTDAAVTRIPPVPEDCGNLQADIVFVLDASQSVGDEGFETLKVFVEDVINSFEVGKNKVRVGILKYSDSARTEFNLNDFYNETELNETISKIVYTMGQTNTGNALDHLRTDMFTPENGDRPNVPNVAIIITDGQSTNPNDTIRAAQEARDAGITLFAVGVGDLAEMSELEEIATDPDAEYVFTVTDYSKLDNIAATFQEAVCPITTELITEAPMTTVAEAYCENYTQADIVFVLDSSVSVGSASFEQLKTFVQTLVADFDVGEDRVRVGIMKYSDKAFTEFNLNDSYNQTDLNETIGNIVYVMGITNTGNALDYLRTQMFTAGNGDRADVPNVAVIITDGKSSDPDDTTRAAQAARDAGIILFTVGVGSGAEMSELREVATDPDSTHVFTATDYSALDSIKSTFQQAVCVPPTTEAPTTTTTTTTTTTPPPTTTTESEPCFDVLPRGCRESGVTVCYAYEEWAQMNCAHYCGFCGKPVELPTTTTTTEAPTTQEPTTTPEPEICEQGDIVFVLDSSVSVGSEDFEFLKQFVTALVSDFDVGPDTVRVGVMKYSDNSSTEFNLIDSASDNDLNGTISGIVYEMGITNTGSALDYLRTSMFTPENGDRPNVPNVGIVITDGKSSDPAETVMAARAARDAGIILFAVGVGSKIDVSELDEIATDPDASHVFTATDYSVLDSEVKSTFQEAVCPLYLGTTQAEKPATTVELPLTTQEMPLTTSTPVMTSEGSGVGGGELVEMSSTVEAPLTTTMEEGSNCTDLSADCKALGYDTCAEYRSWALHYCRRSCDYCSEPFVPEPECCTDQDGWRGCIDKGSGGCTGIYEAWARAHCQAFCGYCEPCPITPCENAIDNCEQFGDYSCVNPSMRQWAYSNCMEHCGLCSNYGLYWERNNITRPTAPAATLVAQTAVPGGCKDLVSDCAAYPKDDCDVYDSFMATYCQDYCGLCPNDTEYATMPAGTPPPIPQNCSDTIENCTSYDIRQHCCGIYEPWARAHCASFCGFCGVEPDRLCTDTIDYCDREPDDLCTNERYLLFRLSNCAGTCKLCDSPWEPPSCSAYLFPSSSTQAVTADDTEILLG